MSEIILFGPAASSYVRTARMTCIEKGAPHRLESVQLGGEAHLALHPWARVPIMRHDKLELIETSAIARYVDESFSGPSLLPATASGRAKMEQWISVVNAYLYDSLVRGYVLKYVIPSFKGEAPNRAEIEAGLPALERDLGRLDAAYRNKSFIAGDALSLADLFVAPILASVSAFPEGKQAIGKTENLGRILGAFAGRKSFQEVHAGLG